MTRAKAWDSQRHLVGRTSGFPIRVLIKGLGSKLAQEPFPEFESVTPLDVRRYQGMVKRVVQRLACLNDVVEAVDASKLVRAGLTKLGRHGHLCQQPVELL